jgi:trans-aconitate 2-methyltransferase
MSTWNAAHYLKYGDERTRPAADLAARVELDAPRTIMDLGCGPGNRRVFRERHPAWREGGNCDRSDAVERSRLVGFHLGWTDHAEHDRTAEEKDNRP